MKNSDIMDWQRRLREAPSVWLVIDSDGVVSNAYESEEAARLEVAAVRRVRIQRMPIHSLRLSFERWRNDFAPATEPGKDGSHG